MQYVPASRFSLTELTALWNAGYEGYFSPVRFTDEQMSTWMSVYDYDLDRSLVLLDGAAPVAFSFLGVRGGSGWVGGFGVVPSHRGKGLSYPVFNEHVSRFADWGLQEVRLEVLVQNWAQKVYERGGFTRSRRLSVLQGSLPEGPAESACGSTLLSDADAFAALLPHSERVRSVHRAVWQREPATLRKSGAAGAFGLVVGPVDSPAAYAIGTVAGEKRIRLMDAAARGLDEARALRQALAASYPGYQATLVNEPEGSPVLAALLESGFAEPMAQYEMIWHG